MAAAQMTLRAHLKKLVDDGLIRVRTIKGEEVYDRSVS
jgi:predicted ArsR family transcriptional regulator